MRLYLDEINEYIVYTICVAVISGITSLISHPSGAKESNMALGVICLLSLAVPALNLFSSFTDIPTLDSIPAYSEIQGGYTDVSEAAFSAGVRKGIAEEFDLAIDEVRVDIRGFDFETMRASELVITLSGAARGADVRSMRVWAEDNFLIEGGKCEVVIDVG